MDELDKTRDELLEENARLRKALEEKDLHRLSDFTPTPYHSLDESGCILDVNTEWLELLGYKKDQVMGRHLSEFIVPEELPLLKKRFPAFCASGRVRGAEYTMVRKDGTTVNVSMDGLIAYDANGKFERTHCVVNDISNQPGRMHEQQFRDLFESSIDGLAYVSTSGELQNANPAFCSMLGFNPSEIQGKQISELCASSWSFSPGAIPIEGEHTEFQKELLHKQGHVVPVSIRIWSDSKSSGSDDGFWFITHDLTRRKQNELMIREGQRSMRALMDATQDIVALFRLDGEIVTANKALALVQDTTPEKLIGENLFSLLPRSLAKKRRAAFSEAVETKKPVEIRDIQMGRIFESVIYPILDDLGKTNMLAVFARDVTEARLAADSLKKSETQYRRIVETANEAILGQDADGRITYVNKVSCEFLGYEHHELIGDSITTFMHPEDLEDHRKRIDERKQGRKGRYERRFIRKDDSVVWGVISAAPIMGETGQYLGVFAMITDITERKEAEQALLESEANYRNIYENSVEGMYQSTPEGRFISVNPAAARLLGYGSPEHMIDSITDIGSQFYYNRDDRNDFTALLVKQHEVRDYEVQLKRADGSPLWVFENARAILDEHDRIVRFEGALVDISERKLTEQALQLTQLSVDKAAMDIYRIDPGGRIIYANDRGASSLGYDSEEILTLHLHDINPDFTEQGWPEYWHNRRKQGVKNFETTHRRKDGTIFPVAVTSHYLEFDGREYLFAYIYDITKRVATEEALRRSETLLNEVQRISLTGGWEMDLKTNQTQWTEGHYRMWGLSPEAEPPAPKEHIAAHVHPDDRDDLLKLWEHMLEDGTPIEMEYRALMPDGKESIFKSKGVPDIDANGKVQRVYGSTRDVTKERQAEEELRHSHNRLLNILDGIDADVYVSSLDNNEILFMNGHMRDTFGQPPEGVPCHKAFRSENSPCSHCPKDKLFDEMGHPVETLVHERYNPVTKRWYLNHDRAIEWLEGKRVHMHMAADITEHKLMEDSLKQAMTEAEAASLAKNEFLANMSHEIRTPLNGLLGMLQLLQLTSLMDEQQDYLQTAMESGKGLLQVLNDILDLSKIESGKLEIYEDKLDLAEVLETTVSVFRYQSEMRGLSMEWTIDPDLPRHFLADKGRLRQILFNLVGNAVKFTESGSVTVEAYPLNSPAEDGTQLIMFTVKDSGIGIPEDALTSIFDPFTQVDGSFTRKYQGTGLGLGIVQRLVGLMGGTTTLSSEPGKGTTVVFTVLAHSLPSMDTGADERASKKEASRPLSILIAEDERVNQVVVERLLTKLGHHPRCVPSGEAALTALKEQEFDCILMDIQMPGIDGLETTRIIRKELKLDTPIIALTAHAMKGDRQRFLQAGMNSYLAKPFAMNDLQEELSKTTSKR